MTGTTVHIPTRETGRLTLRAHRLADFDAYAETLGSARMVFIDRLDRRDACDWAKDRIPSLVSCIGPGNAASIAVARRLGARRDAEAALPDGETTADTHVCRHWGAAA